MSAFLMSQLLAGATLVTGMAAFQFRKREHILRGWFVAALFAAVHFWLLDAHEASLAGTVGSFQKSEQVVRYTMMATELLWATHNIIVWTPVAIAMEVLFFASNLIGLLRHRKASATAL